MLTGPKRRGRFPGAGGPSWIVDYKCSGPSVLRALSVTVPLLFLHPTLRPQEPRGDVTTLHLSLGRRVPRGDVRRTKSLSPQGGPTRVPPGFEAYEDLTEDMDEGPFSPSPNVSEMEDENEDDDTLLGDDSDGSIDDDGLAHV